MRELAAIKVRIGKKQAGPKAGDHQFPDFGQLACVIASGMDWSRYVDVRGEGWHYDKVSGHADDDADSPFGNWDGMLLVPIEFAEQAVAKFPGTVTRLSEVQCKTFYETRVTVRQPALLENVETLHAIVAKRQLGIEETEEDRQALDPDHPSPGITRNPRKTWADFKKKCGLTFKKPPS